MPKATIKLLGSIQATRIDGAVAAISARKAQGLLAYLAMSSGRSHHRDALANLLWGGSTDAAARQSLRQALSNLRRALGANVIKTSGDTVHMDAAVVEVDVQHLEHAALDASGSALEQVEGLYQGDFLSELQIAEPEFENWHAEEQARLRDLAVQVFEKLAARLVIEDPARAIPVAARGLSLDPGCEPLRRSIMQALVHVGRRAAALRQYQSCVEWLDRELGVEPEPETRALFRDILQQSAGTRGAETTIAPPRNPGWTVGRERQASMLAGVLRNVIDGDGRTVVVHGEAGIGKTHLLNELMANAASSGAHILFASCHETEQVLPMRPWVDALRAADAPIAKIGAAKLDDAARQQLSRIFPELTNPADPPRGPGGSPHALFEALLLLLAAICNDRHVAVVIEDMHWADDLSIQFFAFVSRRLSRTRLLLAASVRSEALADAPTLVRALRELRDGEIAIETHLRPLEPSERVDLIKQLQGRAANNLRTETLEQIGEMSEGNPFVIVETMRALAGRAEIAPNTAAPLADRVRGLALARLETLDEQWRDTVDAAAVIGREFSFELLAESVKLEPGELARVVENLVRRRVFENSGANLRFTHEWFRLAAYQRLLPSTLKVIHLAAADATEKLHASDLDSTLDVLGHHYALGGATKKAIAYLRKFYDRAALAYAFDDAFRALDRAGGLAGDLPEIERDEVILALVLQKAFALSVLGRQKEILSLLDEHEFRLSEDSDPAVTSEFYFRFGLTHFFLGTEDEAEGASQRALQVAEAAGVDLAVGKALHVLSLVAFERGEPLLGIEHAERAVAALQAPAAGAWRALVYHDLALNSLVAGKLDQAIDVTELEVATGEASGAPRALPLAASVRAWALALKGEHDDAVEAGQEGQNHARDPVAFALASCALGQAQLGVGENQAALNNLNDAISALHDSPSHSTEARCLAVLSEAYLQLGRPEEARQAARRALDLQGPTKGRLPTGLALRSLGRIDYALKDCGAAATHLLAAIESFEAGDAIFEAALARLDLVRIPTVDAETRAGHLAIAKEVFATANAPRRLAEAQKLMECEG